ncbi:hypothetical protein F5146DRAFT_1171415 [Armillaria mellea]|nr:hypothetical protein F5146DRAFT_1171415 [Armillaria mellea]
MSDVQVNLVVDNTMGAAFIGVITAALYVDLQLLVLKLNKEFCSLYGTWYYFVEYKGDVWYTKTLVAIVWLLESIHQALISHAVYYYVVSNFSNPGQLENPVWSILLEVLCNVGFLSFRVVGSIRRFRRFRDLSVFGPKFFDDARLASNENVPLTTVIAAMVLAEFACSVAFTIQSMKLSTWADLTHMRGLLMTVNVVGAVSDVLIAASLFYFLHRSRTGFKKSDTMISKLILFSISMGLMTSICAVASLISILIWGKTLIYIAFYFSLGRLYSNTVPATLNARKSIREAGDTSDLTLSLNTFKTGFPRFVTTVPQQTNISINIGTAQECVGDDIREGLDSALNGQVGEIVQGFGGGEPYD